MLLMKNISWTICLFGDCAIKMKLNKWMLSTLA